MICSCASSKIWYSTKRLISNCPLATFEWSSKCLIPIQGSDHGDLINSLGDKRYRVQLDLVFQQQKMFWAHATQFILKNLKVELVPKIFYYPSRIKKMLKPPRIVQLLEQYCVSHSFSPVFQLVFLHFPRVSTSIFAFPPCFNQYFSISPVFQPVF